MTALGELSLWIALLMVVWAIVSSLSGRMLGRADLADSGRKALVVASGMLVLALVGLIAGFVTRDFTRVYVATHSSANLPLAYAIAATWSGSAGWVLMVTAAVSVFAAIVTRTGGVRVGPESTQMIVAMGIALVIALTSVCIANPFAQFDFAAADGKGLPALQQSAGFVLVPPIEALALAAVTVACAVARQGAARARKNLLWRIASLLLSLAIALRSWWTYTALEGAHFWRWDLGSGAIVALWLMVASILHDDGVRHRSDSNDTSPALIGFALLFVMVAVAFGGPFDMDASTSTGDPWLRFSASAAILVGAGLAELRSHSPGGTPAEAVDQSSGVLGKLRVSSYLGWVVTLALTVIVVGAVVIPIVDAWMHEAPTSSTPLVGALYWIGAALVVICIAASIRVPRVTTTALLGRGLLHAGIVAAVFGLLFATRTAERELTVRSGESFELRDPFGRPWKLIGQGVSLYDVMNRRVVAVSMEAFRNGVSRGLVKSEKRQIVDQRGEALGDPITGVGFLRGSLLDLRVEMLDASGEVANVRLTFVPLALLVWLGAGLTVIGGLLALIFGRGEGE